MEGKGYPYSLVKERPGITIVIVPNWKSGFTMLSNGEIDAVIVDRWVGQFELSKLNITNIKVNKKPVATRYSRIAVQKGNAELLASINGALQKSFQRMQSHTQPGMTEVDIWSHLHQTNIKWEGEWINARLMTTGSRTNPWSQETSLRVVEPGDIVACDSDLIGPYGYGADISRTWIASGKPTDRQRHLYAQSYEHVQNNIALFQPGTSFLDIAHSNYRLPINFQNQMFTSFAHGIGLENEWPIIKSVHKTDQYGGYGGGYDGELKAGMTLCIESYIGEIGGPDGVKLEEQILITESGPVPFSNTPFEEHWP